MCYAERPLFFPFCVSFLYAPPLRFQSCVQPLRPVYHYHSPFLCFLLPFLLHPMQTTNATTPASGVAVRVRQCYSALPFLSATDLLPMFLQCCAGPRPCGGARAWNVTTIHPAEQYVRGLCAASHLFHCLPIYLSASLAYSDLSLVTTSLSRYDLPLSRSDLILSLVTTFPS